MRQQVRAGACGIQFFEAQIDDQPLPRAAYDDLLARVLTRWFRALNRGR